MQVVTPNEVVNRARQDFETDDGLSRVTWYFGGQPAGDDDDAERLQAFLVEYRPVPGGAIQPHFHKIAQFQVVVGGGGAIGKTPVPVISFQYADPSTPYGPITPDDEQRGIDFLTLRPIATPAAQDGIWWMPGARGEMDGRPGRNRAATVAPDVPLPGSGTEMEDLIESDDDGLAGYVFRLAAGADGVIAVPASSRGQYHLVTRGTVVHDGQALERMALAFATPGETVSLTAGAGGGEVLVMQFPCEPRLRTDDGE